VYIDRMVYNVVDATNRTIIDNLYI